MKLKPLKSMSELDLLLNDYGSVTQVLQKWIELNRPNIHIGELQLWKGILEMVKKQEKSS